MGVIEKITVDSATLAKLEQNALAHGRSVEEEAADLLRKVTSMPSRVESIARLDEIAAMTPKGVKQTDSTLLIREDRDSR
jgi:plasmid stability protein